MTRQTSKQGAPLLCAPKGAFRGWGRVRDSSSLDLLQDFSFCAKQPLPQGQPYSLYVSRPCRSLEGVATCLFCNAESTHELARLWRRPRPCSPWITAQPSTRWLAGAPFPSSRQGVAPSRVLAFFRPAFCPEKPFSRPGLSSFDFGSRPSIPLNVPVDFEL